MRERKGSFGYWPGLLKRKPYVHDYFALERVCGMTPLGPKLLLVCMAFCLVGVAPANAELPELPIQCWARTEADASIVGFVGKTLVVEDTYGNVLYGFNTEDCSEKWTIEHPDYRLTEARIAEGKVFAQFWDDSIEPDDEYGVFRAPGSIMAIDSSTGDVLWEQESLAGYALDFAATSEAVILDGAGGLEVFLASDGELLWSKEPMFAGWLSGFPTISGNTIIRNDSTGSKQGNGAFTAFNLHTGEILWEYAVPQRSLSVNVDPGSNGSVVMFLTFKTIGDSEARVISVLDLTTGAYLLDQADELAIDAVSDGERLFYFTAEAPGDWARPKLKSVDLQTGETRFVVDVDDIGWLVGVADENLLVIEDGKLESQTTTIRAFDATDGSDLWSRELEGTGDFGSPAHVLSGDDLILAHDDRFAIVDSGDGSVLFEALLPVLKTEYARSDTGWCHEGDFHRSSLHESEGIIALETCTNAVAIIDAP
jgi:outer membrane protein assembly factor BamB